MRLDAARRRIDGSGGQRQLGIGEEWVGFRPYRPGDDPRRLDWQLLGRLDRPFVRVTRRESSEQWVVLLDTSGSMSVGEPSKLQAAAEIAAAWAAYGLRLGAEVTVRSSAMDGPGRGFDRPAALPELLQWFEDSTASGDRGLEPDSFGPDLRRAGRAMVVTDLSGPPADAILEAGVRRRLSVVQVLAPVEFAPDAGRIRWVDPERGGRLPVDVDARLASRYDALLSARLEQWRATLARHGIEHAVHEAGAPFESALESLALGLHRSGGGRG